MHKNSSKGFTLVEILIAVSVIAIITAIALPNFTNMIAKSKLRSDVQTAISVQNAVDLYMAEYGKSPLDGATTGETDAQKVVTNLYTKGYLKTDIENLQTEGAALDFDNNTRLVTVDLTEAKGLNQSIIDSISSQDKAFIKDE